MSTINNQVKALNNIADVQDLSSETAAAVQGGADLEVYRHANGAGWLGGFNFGKDKLSSDANDQISSVRVNAGRWILFQNSNYNVPIPGLSWVVSGKGLHNVPSWFNDKTSSIRRF